MAIISRILLEFRKRFSFLDEFFKSHLKENELISLIIMFFLPLFYFLKNIPGDLGSFFRMLYPMLLLLLTISIYFHKPSYDLAFQFVQKCLNLVFFQNLIFLGLFLEQLILAPSIIVFILVDVVILMFLYVVFVDVYFMSTFFQLFIPFGLIYFQLRRRWMNEKVFTEVGFLTNNSNGTNWQTILYGLNKVLQSRIGGVPLAAPISNENSGTQQRRLLLAKPLINNKIPAASHLVFPYFPYQKHGVSSSAGRIIWGLVTDAFKTNGYAVHAVVVSTAGLLGTVVYNERSLHLQQKNFQKNFDQQEQMLSGEFASKWREVEQGLKENPENEVFLNFRRRLLLAEQVRKNSSEAQGVLPKTATTTPEAGSAGPSELTQPPSLVTVPAVARKDPPVVVPTDTTTMSSIPDALAGPVQSKFAPDVNSSGVFVFFEWVQFILSFFGL